MPMQTLPTPYPVDYSAPQAAFAVALALATAAAHTAYPADTARIERGAALVRSGHVTLQTGQHEALVISGRNATVYHVNGQCQCSGYQFSTTGRCSHRYAKALYGKAMALLALLWFAEVRCGERVISGFARLEAEDAACCTFYRASDHAAVVLLTALVDRRGRCDLVAAQALADGMLY